MKTETKKAARVLDAPANYNLQECLQELKAGRRAKDQLFLQKMIEELNTNMKTPQEIKAEELVNNMFEVTTDAEFFECIQS